MSFSNINDVLSRDEMKKIMAGSGEGGGEACGSWLTGCIGDSTHVYWCNCNNVCSFQYSFLGCYA